MKTIMRAILLGPDSATLIIRGNDGLNELWSLDSGPYGYRADFALDVLRQQRVTIDAVILESTNTDLGIRVRDLYDGPIVDASIAYGEPWRRMYQHKYSPQHKADVRPSAYTPTSPLALSFLLGQ